MGGWGVFALFVCWRCLLEGGDGVSHEAKRRMPRCDAWVLNQDSIEETVLLHQKAKSSCSSC